MKKTIFILLSIIILAIGFRLAAVLNPGSFWFDEIISLKIAQHNILDSWQYLKWENNPPLHYWFLHYWIKFFGLSETILRLSSILFSLLTIIALYFLGKILFNKTVGLMASFLLAVSSFQLFLSSDARMYPMFLLLSILSCYFFWQLLNGPRKYSWIAYIIFTILAFYTHLIGLFLLIIHNLYFIYHFFYLKKRQPNWHKWLIIQLTILGLFLPWLINFALRSLAMFNNGAWYLHTNGGGFLLLQIPQAFLIIGNKIPLLELAALIIFSVLFMSAFAKIYQWSLKDKEFKVKLNFSPPIVFAFLLFLIPLGFGFLIQLWVAKYYLIGTIGFYLLLAVGYNNLKLPLTYKKLLILLIILLLTPFNLNLIKNNKHSWNKVANYVDSVAKADDKILISAFIYQIVFEHYYHGPVKIFSYQPQGLEDNELLKAVKYNWLPVLTKDNLPDLKQLIGSTKRIIIVHPAKVEILHNADLAINWFIKHHWKLEQKKQFGGFVQPTVLIFSAPTKAD